MSAPPAAPTKNDRRRWIALVVVCAAMLMNSLDGTIVNIAMPSIQADLGFTQANLAWVADAYLITFGSLLLMAGRLGDLVGRKKVFMGGVAFFTVSSIACGLAESQGALIAARFFQGAGAAISSSVIIAIIVTEFSDPLERAKAMSVYIFVAVSGGSVGLLFGGVLVQAVDWHWIFFINLPIGLATLVAGRSLLDENEGLGVRHGVDVLGSVLVTGALMVGIYGIITASEHGWVSAHTLTFGGVASVMLIAFFVLETRISNPIMPMRIFAVPNLLASSLIRGLAATGMYSAFFLGALYLQRARGFDPVRVGFAFLPMTLTAGVLSSGVAVKLITRFGARKVLYPGLLSLMIGLGLLASVSDGTSYFPTLGLAFLFMGFGASSSFMSLLTIAMADVPPRDAGLASGIVNVSMQLFAAIGLAALGTIASNRTRSLASEGQTPIDALIGGYHLAFGLAAACVALGLVIAPLLLRARPVEVEAAATEALEIEPTA